MYAVGMADGEHLQDHRLAEPGRPCTRRVVQQPIDAHGVGVVAPAQIAERVDDPVVLGGVGIAEGAVERRA